MVTCGRAVLPCREEVTSMRKINLRYARFACSTLTTAMFGLLK
jgi:hypothetical protein